MTEIQILGQKDVSSLVGTTFRKKNTLTIAIVSLADFLTAHKMMSRPSASAWQSDWKTRPIFYRSAVRYLWQIFVPTCRSLLGNQNRKAQVAGVSVSTRPTIRNPGAISDWRTTATDHSVLSKDPPGSRDLAQFLNRYSSSVLKNLVIWLHFKTFGDCNLATFEFKSFGVIHKLRSKTFDPLQPGPPHIGQFDPKRGNNAKC